VSEEHVYVEPDSANGDVRVYPSLFPRRREHGDFTEHQEFVATEVRISIDQGTTRHDARGKMKTDHDVITINAYDAAHEHLAVFELHPEDARKLMQTLVYTVKGWDAVEALKKLPDSPTFPNPDDGGK
jgi:hypothetical protein